MVRSSSSIQATIVPLVKASPSIWSAASSSAIPTGTDGCCSRYLPATRAAGATRDVMDPRRRRPCRTAVRHWPQRTIRPLDARGGIAHIHLRFVRGAKRRARDEENEALRVTLRPTERFDGVSRRPASTATQLHRMRMWSEACRQCVDRPAHLSQQWHTSRWKGQQEAPSLCVEQVRRRQLLRQQLCEVRRISIDEGPT